jgi:energy-coupling factor transporter ATP-binding protein EcfA2
MGFKNKSTAIAFIKTVLQTKVNRFNTIEQLAQHVKPKINNMKDLGIDINAKQNSIIHKGLKQLKQLNTKKGQEKQQAITKMINKFEKQINTKTWNITGQIKIIAYYHENIIYKRRRLYTYDQEEIDSIIFKGTKDDTIEEFKRQMFEKYNRIDPSPDIEYKVVEIIITSMVEHTTTTTQQQDIPMKSATQLMYNYIDEYKDFLQDTGTCVIDNFIGMYGKELKLTRDGFISMCKEYNEENWTPEYGVSPRCVNSICEKYDIAHYAFDVNKSCFIKNISNNRNHKAFIYYSVNNHMYLILDKDIRKSLIEQVKVKENFNTSLLSNDDNDNDNIFDTYNIIVNPQTLFMESKDTVYMYSRQGTTNINDIFEHIVQDHGVPKNIKCKKTKVVSFKYLKNKINYVFTCDPNDTNQITFKEVQVLCEKNSLPFKNQTFMQVVKQLSTKYFDELNGRIHFSKDFKQLVLDKSKNTCTKCACCLKGKKYDIDHIRPLSNGGTNELNNLQVLCKACHQDKTANEQENGQFVKFSDTESCFNENVQEIMNSPLSHSFAFVEPIAKPGNKKIFTIDINKCRRNILLHNKHDYCIFNVMDEPKTFNVKSPIFEGLYYIETDNYLPLRGNGWYYHSIVNYCLHHNIITRDQIKYVIKASSTIDHDYYNGFINYCNDKILSYQEIQDYYNDKVDQNINFEGVEQDDEMHYDMLDNGEYEGIYTVRDKCIISDYKKSSINSMIGGFKPNNIKKPNWYSIIITQSYKEALLNCAKHDESFIYTFSNTSNALFFHVLAPHKTTNIETERPIYDQIVQQEAMELHILKTLVESKGGTVTDLNTDAITCTFEDDIFPFELIDDKNLNYYWDDNKTTPKYKLEPVGKHVKYPKLVKYMRFEEYIIEKKEWNTTPDVEGNDFEPLVNKIIDSKQSWLITGPPGAGKTTLINTMKEKITDNGHVYKCLAPTNLAALLIEGSTIHKFSCKLKKLKKFMDMKLDYIFIDEVSMLHSNFYKILMVIKKLKQCKLIISGDFNQLDVINDVQKYDYKSTCIIKELCDNNNLQLTKCRRSDDKLFNLIQFDNIPNLTQDNFNDKDADVNICWTNAKRKEINDKYMNAAWKKAKTKNYIKLDKLPYDENSQNVTLVNKTPLIGKVNNSKLGIINNERYIIKKVDIQTKELTITNDRNEMIIKEDQFQYLFRIGYAFTTHSSQGMSIDKPYTIHEFNRMSKKLKYVALSRSTKHEYINIM